MHFPIPCLEILRLEKLEHKERREGGKEEKETEISKSEIHGLY